MAKEQKITTTTTTQTFNTLVNHLNLLLLITWLIYSIKWPCEKKVGAAAAVAASFIDPFLFALSIYSHKSAHAHTHTHVRSIYIRTIKALKGDEEEDEEENILDWHLRCDLSFSAFQYDAIHFTFLFRNRIFSSFFLPLLLLCTNLMRYSSIAHHGYAYHPLRRTTLTEISSKIKCEKERGKMKKTETKHVRINPNGNDLELFSFFFFACVRA